MDAITSDFRNEGYPVHPTIQVRILEDLNMIAPEVLPRRTSTQYLVLTRKDTKHPQELPSEYVNMQVKLTITGWFKINGVCGFRVKMPPVLRGFYEPVKEVLNGTPIIITSCELDKIGNPLIGDIVPTEPFTVWGILEQVKE